MLYSNIFLSGGGDVWQTKKLDILFKRSLNGTKLLYIPWAIYPARYNLAFRWINYALPWLEIVLFEEGQKWDVKEMLEQFDGLYIWWGNTYRLLKLLKSTGFDEMIKIFIKSQKPIYWVSAWAIILWKQIGTAPDANVVKLDLSDSWWLNLLAWWAIYPHYKLKRDYEIFDYVKSYQIPVIAIPEGEWVVVKDKKLYSVNKGKVWLFNESGSKSSLGVALS